MPRDCCYQFNNDGCSKESPHPNNDPTRSPELVHHFCKICLRKNLKKVHAAKACKGGTAGQWLAHQSGIETPDASEPSDTIVITEPTDIIENPLASEHSAISTRQELEQLFTVWKKSPSHQTQPLNPTHVRNQAFDFKPNLNFDDFVQNLQQNKKLILSGHFSQILKEILKIPPKMGSNCEPDKEDFYW